MPSRSLLFLGAGFAGLMILVAVVGSAAQLWWLVVLAGTLLLSAVLLVGLDADRRVRETRRFLHQELRRLDSVGPQRAPAPTSEDVVGTVRALQAQYTGRLDRLQDAVDEVLRRDDRD